MIGPDFEFLFPKREGHLIRVIGVGGAGSNAVNYLYNKGITHVDYLICNTDSQALQKSPLKELNKLLIGANLTSGLGSGANPEIGRLAAVESEEDIRYTLSPENKLAFITAGMGKGTGTGAAPVIARVVKSAGILTVGVVTAPFSFEGRRKIEQAYIGIEALKQHCDTLIIIPNDKLLQIYPNLGIREAFLEGDQILVNSIISVIGIISKTGYMNVDFADIATVMRNAGTALISFAEVSGTDRAIQGANALLASPLLGGDICGAKHIILSITCSSHKEVSMNELFIMTEYIAEKVGMEPDNVILGHVIDDSLDDALKLSMIATGFNEQLLDVFKNVQTETAPGPVPKPVVQQLSIDGTLDQQLNPLLVRFEEPPRVEVEVEIKSSAELLTNQITLPFVMEKGHSHPSWKTGNHLKTSRPTESQPRKGHTPWSTELKTSRFNLSELE